MTIFGYLLRHLTDLGMPVEDAEAVLRLKSLFTPGADLSGWDELDRECAGADIRRIALAYIDANDPTAPYRERFLEGNDSIEDLKLSVALGEGPTDDDMGIPRE